MTKTRQERKRVGGLTVTYFKISEDQAPVINPKLQRVQDALRKVRERKS